MYSKNLEGISGYERRDIVKMIEAKPPRVKGIMIFGSCVVFGKTHHNSDIDILLLTDVERREEMECSTKLLGRMFTIAEAPIDLMYISLKEYVKQVNMPEESMDCK